MIRSRMPLLRVEKEIREGRKLPIRVIADETDLSPGAVQRLMTLDAERVDFSTLNSLCKYFNCGIGELLEYVEEVEGVSA